MKKVIVFTLMALCTSGYVMAQKNDNFKFSVGAELSIPTGYFSKSQSVGVGATGQVEVPVQNNLYVTGTAGVILYNGKSISVPGFPNANAKAKGQIIVPIKVGGKYFFTEGIYGAAQFGVGVLSNYFSGTAFAYSPQIGYEFKTKGGSALDASFRYDGYSKNQTLGALGFRLAYIF